MAHSHFRQRVAERISPDVDADALAARILASIEADDGWCRFKCRERQFGRSVYRFDLPPYGQFFVIVSTLRMVVVTVLEPGGYVQRANPKGSARSRRVRLRVSGAAS